MPEDFDLPIDGEFDESSGGDDQPARKRRAVTPARRKVATPIRAAKRVVRRAAPVRHSEDEYEEIAAPLRSRPRIAIDAATSAPRRVNMYRRLALSFLAATICVIGIIVFFTFQRASVTVTQEPMSLAATFGVVIANDAATATVASSTPASTQVFQGIVMAVTTSTEQSFTPSTTSDKPGKSHGNVIVHNNGATPQSLVATTRFLSESGVLFRAVKPVVVPPHSTATVEIAADKPGAQGDVPATRFTIPGLAAAQQKVVFGTTDKPMSGGNAKVGTVSQADIDKAQEHVRKQLFEIGQNSLNAVQIPTGFELLYTPVNIKAESSAKAGDQTDQFTVTLSGTMAFVAYPKDVIFAAADREVQNKLPTPYHKVVFVNEAPIVSLQTINVENKTAILQIYREGRAELDARSVAFQPAQFIGRSKQEIMDQIKTIKGVKEVDVALFPFWVERAPKTSSRIQVQIGE